MTRNIGKKVYFAGKYGEKANKIVFGDQEINKEFLEYLIMTLSSDTTHNIICDKKIIFRPGELVNIPSLGGKKKHYNSKKSKKLRKPTKKRKQTKLRKKLRKQTKRRKQTKKKSMKYFYKK
jgi:hypothetical protein